jgi:hypothetical protein
MFFTDERRKGYISLLRSFRHPLLRMVYKHRSLRDWEARNLLFVTRSLESAH